jgi:EAL domain-containing protein (putative c-di-GMP-specific phosphodiesterase class I)
VLPIGRWVFQEACRQLSLWHIAGIAPQVVSVNVSGLQFKAASELDCDVEASVTRWGINPSCLELELTESVLMEATQDIPARWRICADWVRASPSTISAPAIRRSNT